MKRAIILIIISTVFLVACGTGGNNTQARGAYQGENENYDYQFTDGGLELTANIEVGAEITIDATIKNVSDETIVYNGRCGVPFYISIQMAGTTAHLAVANSDDEIACEDIFDSNDLEDFEAGETFEKTVTFTREFAFWSRKNTPLHEGDYLLQFGFSTFDSGHLYTEYPIYLKSDVEPEILTKEEAEKLVLEHDEVNDWRNEQEENGLEAVTERALLTDEEWFFGFHSVDDKLVHRMIVAINHDSGKITRVDYESFELLDGMEHFLDDL